MTRSVVIRVRRSCDRRGSMISKLFDNYLRWGIGPYVITYRRRNSNWTRPGWVLISLGPWRAVGIQSQPDLPIILVHCQDLKKIPPPSGLVSWIDAARLVDVPAPLVLGASTMDRTMQGPPSIAIIPPEGGAVLSESASVKSAQLLPDSLSGRLEGSRIDVSSAAPSITVVVLPQEVLLVDAASNLHPYFTHRLDAGLSDLQRLLMR